MKKIILSITSLYMMIASATYSIEQAAAGAVAGLMPILKPIAEETVIASIGHLRGILSGSSCWLGCTKVGQAYCITDSGRSFCKGSCQKIYYVGGFELRIRFAMNANNTEKWSLGACVRRGVNSGDTNPEGKGIENSIAVYSQPDLEKVLNIIAFKMAAETIVETGGANISDAQLAAAKKKSRQAAVEEAKKVVKTITDSLNKDVYKKYGPQ